MSIVNTLVRVYLKRLIEELEQIKYSAILQQEQQLSSILRNKYSHHYQLESKNDFIALNPTGYDFYKNSISNRLDNKASSTIYSDVRLFAKSAGTSSHKSKYIPTSQNYLKQNHLKASWLALSILYNLRPDMDVFGHKSLLVGGAIYNNDDDAIIADISGLLINNIPKPFHKYYTPRIKEALNPNWEEKLEITAQKAATTDDVVLFGGVPTWILTLFKRILEISNHDNLIDLWPHAKAYLHGGVNFEPYREQFEELLPSSTFQYLEVYNASEGFFAVQDTKENRGLLLLTNHGIYYEFIKRDDYGSGYSSIENLQNVVLDQEYILLITTTSGLYRYIIGDVITFVSVAPHRIRIKGRIEEFINAFGEDLTYSIAHNALNTTLKDHHSTIRNYTACPNYLSINNKGYHQWFIEFEKAPESLKQFSIDLDLRIQESNFNYFQKRSNNLALKNLEIIPLISGFFDDLAKKKGKFGGQNKLRKLRNDRILAEEIFQELTKIHMK